jgi:hypothetical protein
MSFVPLLSQELQIALLTLRLHTSGRNAILPQQQPRTTNRLPRQNMLLMD